ncbi:MAG: hypothetical protein ABI863_01315 [Ginsengibacter sp.]
MPFKFVLYHAICIVSIILQSLFMVYIGCRAIFFKDIHFDGGIISIFILILYFTLFFGNSFLGLALYKKLSNDTDVSKKEIKTLKIFFFIQLSIQLFSLIFQLFNIDDLMRKIQRMYLYSHLEFYDNLVFDILPLLVLLLTFYYEIFTFPLVKAIKRKYECSQNDFNSIGEGLI